MAKKQTFTPAPSPATPPSARTSTQETHEQRETKERARSPKAPAAARSAKAAKATAGSAAVSKPAPANGKVKTVPTRASRASNSEGQGRVVGWEEIALRAYFISERRRAQGECREPSEDWLQAERELLRELQSATRTKR